MEATDRAGNKGTVTRVVTLDSTPPVAPVLEQLPTPTSNPAATVKGSAEAGSSVILYLSGTQIATATADAGGLFSFANIALTEGGNIFTAGTIDKAGNPGQPSAPQLVTLDTVKPVVAITAPQQGAALNTRTITVSGSIDDPTASVTVNGLSALSSGGTWTLEGFVLQEGSNTLLVEARDAAGNKGSANVTVILDTIPPVVTITAPLDALYTNMVQVAVTGTVNEEVVSVTVNGVAASLSTTLHASSTFFGTLALTEGANSIIVTAVEQRSDHLWRKRRRACGVGAG